MHGGKCSLLKRITECNGKSELPSAGHWARWTIYRPVRWRHSTFNREDSHCLQQVHSKAANAWTRNVRVKGRNLSDASSHTDEETQDEVTRPQSQSQSAAAESSPGFASSQFHVLSNTSCSRGMGERNHVAGSCR